MNMKFAVAFLAVGLASATTAPDAPTLYEVEDKMVPSGQSAKYEFWKGGNQTVIDCSNRCDSWVGCVGFTFQYMPTTADAGATGICTGYADAAGTIGLSPAVKTSQISGVATAGSATYMRLAASDGVTAVRVAATPVSFKGASTLEVPSNNFSNYTVWDRNACSKELPGGNEQLFKIGKRSNDLTGAECAQLCEAYLGCIGFGHKYAGSYAGMCTGYKKSDTPKTVGCNLEPKGETGNAFYFRNAGEVTTAACAPVGTDINGFTACTSDFSAAPGAGSSSTAVPLVILSVLAAVWAL